MPLLKGKRLQLRAPEPEDLEILYEWENNTENWHVSGTQKPFSKDILRQYLLHAHKDIYEARQIRFVIEIIQDRVPIGFIDLFDYDPQNLHSGVGILIGPNSSRGKGYAFEALNILIAYCRTALQLKQIHCSIPIDNHASIALFEKAQFIKYGHRKEWLKRPEGFADELLYQLILD